MEKFEKKMPRDTEGLSVNKFGYHYKCYRTCTKLTERLT